MELDYFDNPGVAPVQPFESLSPPANDPRTRYNDSVVDPDGQGNSSSSSLGKYGIRISTVRADTFFLAEPTKSMLKCRYSSQMIKKQTKQKKTLRSSWSRSYSMFNSFTGKKKVAIYVNIFNDCAENNKIILYLLDYPIIKRKFYFKRKTIMFF